MFRIESVGPLERWPRKVWRLKPKQVRGQSQEKKKHSSRLFRPYRFFLSWLTFTSYSTDLVELSSSLLSYLSSIQYMSLYNMYMSPFNDSSLVLLIRSTPVQLNKHWSYEISRLNKSHFCANQLFRYIKHFSEICWECVMVRFIVVSHTWFPNPIAQQMITNMRRKCGKMNSSSLFHFQASRA